MRIEVDHFPENGVEIEKQTLGFRVRLYKDLERTTDAEGNERLSADIQESSVNVIIDENSYVQHFDEYFKRWEQAEFEKWLPTFEQSVQKLLDNTDFKLLKFQDGAMTEEEYKPWKEYRQALRDTINAMRNAGSVNVLKTIIIPEAPAS